MTNISEGAGRVIAAGITGLFNATDRLLLDSAKLTADVLEGTEGSGLHPRSKQILLEQMHAASASVLDGRKRMIGAHRQMISIQAGSNLEVVDYGCWGDGPSVDDDGKRAGFFTGATLSGPQPV